MGKSINPETINAVTNSMIDILKQAVPSFAVAPVRYNPVLRNAEGNILWISDETYAFPESAIQKAEEVRAAGFTEGNAS